MKVKEVLEDEELPLEAVDLLFEYRLLTGGVGFDFDPGRRLTSGNFCGQTGPNRLASLTPLQ